MKRRVAIVGAGITLFRRRMLESPKELPFEASKMALDSAGLTLKDIQSVVSGSAPDAFDGVHMKGEYYFDGMGAIGKPHERVYVGGGTGVFTPIGGWWNVASGMYDTVLCVAEEKMSPLHPHPQYAFWSIFEDRKSTRLNSSHANISYAVFCLKKKNNKQYKAPLALSI